jgi:hypothetical protein
MRFALVALILCHAVIHLLGFVKAFGLADVAALRQPIGSVAGGLWLLASLLLATSAALNGVGNPRWSWVAAAGIVLSQGLIVGAWSDARFGTLANLIIAVPVVLALADMRAGSLRSQYRRTAADLVAASPLEKQTVVTEAELDAVPPLVRGYLRRSGVVGRPRVVNFRATFRADMKNGRDAPWMSATVEMYEFFEPMARLFYMTAARSGIPFSVFHQYVGREASMRVRIAGIWPMVDASGPTMTRSETVTLLNDMCILAPATLLSAAIAWTPIDASHVRAEFTNGAHTISAILSFDAQGDLVNFRSEDRHQYDGTVDKQLPWLTPVSAYRDFGGVRLAEVGEAQWLETDGLWTYGRFVLQRIDYNVRVP